jgi:ribosomal protein S17
MRVDCAHINESWPAYCIRHVVIRFHAAREINVLRHSSEKHSTVTRARRARERQQAAKLSIAALEGAHLHIAEVRPACLLRALLRWQRLSG